MRPGMLGMYSRTLELLWKFAPKVKLLKKECRQCCCKKVLPATQGHFDVMVVSAASLLVSFLSATQSQGCFLMQSMVVSAAKVLWQFRALLLSLLFSSERFF